MFKGTATPDIWGIYRPALKKKKLKLAEKCYKELSKKSLQNSRGSYFSPALFIEAKKDLNRNLVRQSDYLSKKKSVKSL